MTLNLFEWNLDKMRRRRNEKTKWSCRSFSLFYEWNKTRIHSNTRPRGFIIREWNHSTAFGSVHYLDIVQAFNVLIKIRMENIKKVSGKQLISFPYCLFTFEHNESETKAWNRLNIPLVYDVYWFARLQLVTWKIESIL